MSIESARSTVRLLLSIRQSKLPKSTEEMIFRVLASILRQKGSKEKTEATDKLSPLIESGISEEDLLQVLEEMEADL